MWSKQGGPGTNESGVKVSQRKLGALCNAAVDYCIYSKNVSAGKASSYHKLADRSILHFKTFLILVSDSLEANDSI